MMQRIFSVSDETLDFLRSKKFLTISKSNKDTPTSNCVQHLDLKSIP